MENAIKIHHENNITTSEGYTGNNKMVLGIEDNLANSKDCTLTEEVHDNRISNMITYHVINNADANITKQEFDYLQANIFPITNYKFIKKSKNTVLKQKNTTAKNCHRIIAPKLGDVNYIKTDNVCLESKKRKDDKRRSTHNEIERRRRNKINNCIFKLKELIPDGMEIPKSSSELNCKTSSTDSKSQILIRAYDYIEHMQKEIKSLREYKKENDQLRLSNQELHNKIIQLQNRTS